MPSRMRLCATTLFFLFQHTRHLSVCPKLHPESVMDATRKIRYLPVPARTCMGPPRDSWAPTSAPPPQGGYARRSPHAYPRHDSTICVMIVMAPALWCALRHEHHHPVPALWCAPRHEHHHPVSALYLKQATWRVLGPLRNRQEHPHAVLKKW